MTSQSTDYGLSDDTCQDYLWFDTSASGYPQRICGDEFKEFNDELHTQSLIGILWTNCDNGHDKYEILVQCSGKAILESSGDVENCCHNIKWACQSSTLLIIIFILL